MQYKILGNTMPAVEILFDQPGESMYTQSGGMAWMSDGVEMDTNPSLRSSLQPVLHRIRERLQSQCNVSRWLCWQNVCRRVFVYGKLYRQQTGGNHCVCFYGSR